MSSTNTTSSTDGPELGCEEAVANSRRFPKAGVTEARVLRQTPRRFAGFRCGDGCIPQPFGIISISLLLW